MTQASRDADLIAKIKAQESLALSELYDAYSGTVYALACRIVRDPAAAETVVQQSFLSVWRRASQYDPAKGSFVAWLLAIVRNYAIDELRKRKADQRFTLMETESLAGIVDDSESRNPLSGSIENERRRYVLHALNEIPENQKLPIYLAYYDGLSHREIAAKLNEPLGTIKTRIQLGMEKLREALKPLKEFSK